MRFKNEHSFFIGQLSIDDKSDCPSPFGASVRERLSLWRITWELEDTRELDRGRERRISHREIN